MTPVRRLALAAAAALVAVTALSACSPQTAGSAATVGDTRITEQQLAAEVAAIQEAKGQDVTASDPAVVQQTLGRLVTKQLIDDLVAKEGLVITQGQLDEQMANFEGQAGGREALEKLFIEQNVAPSQLESMVRLQVQAQQLGIKLDPSGSAEQQGQAVFAAAAKLSDELGTQVSPRYGTWDPQRLGVGPVANDLSTPPALG